MTRWQKFVRWWVTPPPANAFTLTNLRQLCRWVHTFRAKHVWQSGYQREYIRECQLCGREEWLMYSRKTGEYTWELYELPDLP